jgi:hypothetical protein
MKTTCQELCMDMFDGHGWPFRTTRDSQVGILLGLSSDLSLSPSQLTRPPNHFSSFISSILVIAHLDTDDADKGT